MKHTIQKLANRFGYIVRKFPKPPLSDSPFLVLQWLLRRTHDPIIFDVGAHHGRVSKEFRRLFPTATIYAFEPFKKSFDELKANTKNDPKIHIFNFGLSDKEETRSFHSNISPETNSLLSTDEPGGARTWGAEIHETNEIIEAEFKTIDSVLQMLQISRIDLLKLDVQGAEHLVMAGASDACRKKVIRFIYSEIIMQPTYTSQKRFDRALAAFYDRSFDLFGIYNMSKMDTGTLRQIDAIFTGLETAELDC